ncbi:hypothetical protein U9M48_023267 [Paspalum notatum var. saurae]|uniref:Uncharacterized protein n=1 Tax=Paspalum notatum var. saurae TaxID=547442 RepID=A0AAQ3TP59_PASNO
MPTTPFYIIFVSFLSTLSPNPPFPPWPPSFSLPLPPRVSLAAGFSSCVTAVASSSPWPPLAAPPGPDPPPPRTTSFLATRRGYLLFSRTNVGYGGGRHPHVYLFSSDGGSPGRIYTVHRLLWLGCSSSHPFP